MTLIHYDLTDYIQLLKDVQLLKSGQLNDSKQVTVQHIAYQSKNVVPGTLFICKSYAFKQEYLEDAISRGAIGYVSETDYSIENKVPFIQVSDIRLAMALITKTFYNNPQEQLTLIGVGGTKGKTTTTYYIKAILDAYLKGAGKKPAGLISSITIYDGLSEAAATNTTPEAIDLQRHLAQAVKAGLEYVVLEVSSQALKYHRTAGLEFEVGVFLNIDEDHISPAEHPDFKDYLHAKTTMFGQTKSLVLNNDTQEKDFISQKARAAEMTYTFSMVSKDVDYFVTDVRREDLGSAFRVQSEGMDERYTLSMPGEYNVENALAAIAVADLLEVPHEAIREALSQVNVPGRMQVFTSEDKMVVGISDYAHNRLSFETLIRSVKKTYPEYQIISVFGAPGGKALGRRQELGTVGGRYSDFVLLTMDDPGYESVADISQEIAHYVEQESTPFRIVADREMAIREAFSMASERTVILAIGKGHETTMKIKGQEEPMQSDEQVLELLVKQYDRTQSLRE